MARLFLPALALAFLSHGCSWFASTDDWSIGRSPENGKPTQPTGETTLVYGVLSQLYSRELSKPQATLLVIQETLPVTKHKSMTFPQDYAAVHHYLDTVDKGCVTSFLKVNKQRYELPPLTDPPTQMEPTTVGRINLLFHGGGWQNLLRTYPHAQVLVSLARPGVCQDHQQALLYVMGTKGDGTGDGTLIQAALVNDAWQITKKAVISRADAL